MGSLCRQIKLANDDIPCTTLILRMRNLQLTEAIVFGYFLCLYHLLIFCFVSTLHVMIRVCIYVIFFIVKCKLESVVLVKSKLREHF